MYPVYLFLFNEMSCLYLHAPLATSCPVGRSVLPHEQLQVRRSQRRWLHDQSTVIRTYSARVVGSLFGRSFLISCSLDWYTNTNHHYWKEGGPIKFSTNQRVVNNKAKSWVLSSEDVSWEHRRSSDYAWVSVRAIATSVPSVRNGRWHAPPCIHRSFTQSLASTNTF